MTGSSTGNTWEVKRLAAVAALWLSARAGGGALCRAARRRSAAARADARLMRKLAGTRGAELRSKLEQMVASG
jgi:hypothetical protein